MPVLPPPQETNEAGRDRALATHGYTIQVQNFILLFALATGFACEILVGHLIGAGKLHAANALVGRSLRVGLMVSTGLALLAALAGPWLMRHFTNDAQILKSATTLLWIAVLVEPGRVFNVVYVNTLRATGPPTTKPAISTPLPAVRRLRADRFTRRGVAAPNAAVPS